MDLHDGYLVAGVVGVFVECDQSWLAGLDELDESRHAPALSLELSCFESVGRDEDERRRHGAFLCRLVAPVDAVACEPCSSSGSAGLREERVRVGGELAVVLEEKAVGRVWVD